VAGLEPNRRLPFVGGAAFAHKGGIHVQAVSIDARTYEHVDPAAVGNDRRILVSELSGRNNVIEAARAHGLDAEESARVARDVARKLKELESEGARFEDAEASFDLLVRRASEAYQRPFEARAYTVDSRKRVGEEATSSLAAAEVSVGGEVLRGEAVGGGPVNALEHALRNALQPAYPALARIVFTDFRAQIAQGREQGRGTVRVRLTATVDGGGTWTTVGSAPDLLHAAWLALVDSLEHAVDRRIGVEGSVHVDRGASAAIPLAELAPLLAAEPDPEPLAVIAAIDWRTTTLDLADRVDRELAARAAAQGAALAYSFANFCAIAAHPDRRSVVRVNLVKGRPENQVGSVTTTRDRVDRLFDWSQLPDGLTRASVLALMDDFYDLGPMGFRGPAAAAVPDHLSSLDCDIRTTQLIAPGVRCPSNDLLDDVLERAGLDFLFVTSANVSSGITGRVEPAHYDLRGIQDDFGDADGIVLIGHRDEAVVRASYPRHLPMSTSILAFHRLPNGDDGRPALVLERHGSLHVDDVRAVASRHGLGLVLGEGARKRLPLRDDVVGADEVAPVAGS
jgi:tRNA A37 threonylcarbamoyladenosine synthetase subunit TsaC/SUA5/YrdC